MTGRSLAWTIGLVIGVMLGLMMGRPLFSREASERPRWYLVDTTCVSDAVSKTEMILRVRSNTRYEVSGCDVTVRRSK